MRNKRRSISRKIVAGLTAVGVALVAGWTLVGGSSAAAGAAPENAAPPTISGKAVEGQALTADPGSWHSTSNVDYSYQWRRCNTAGNGCFNLSKATDKLYTVRSADIGHTLRVLVTAVNNDGAGTAQSKPTAVVTAAPAQAPQNTAPPTIGGNAKQGEVLTASAGSWQGTNPIDVAYRWRLCDAKGGDCINTSVTTQTYNLGAGEVGKSLRVLVTATNSAGSGAAISNPSSVVQGTGTTPPPPTTTGSSGGCPSIAQVSSTDRLIVDQIRYSPSSIQSRSEPLVARFHVLSTRGGCVSGAVVYAVGVPFDRLSQEPEATTGGDGWATISFQILSTFQLRQGNLVVIFVRARKPGDSLLAGASTRRLVSVRVG